MVGNEGIQLNIETQGRVLLQISPPQADVIQYTNISQIASPVVDISLVSGKFPDKVTICFSKSERVEKISDTCLGYLDESVFPPEWVCQDRCLKEKENRLLCGDTNHFTNFAILLGGDNGSHCSNDSQYITGSWSGDIILIAVLIGSLCLLCFLIFLLSIFCSPCKRLIYGRKTYIQKSLQKNSQSEVELFVQN